MRTATRALGSVLALLTAATLASCTPDSSEGSGPTPPVSSSPTDSPTDSPTEPVALSFGVYGTTEEVAAYSKMAHHFDTTEERADVTIVHYDDDESLRRAVEKGDPLPDVFLVSRRDLQWYLDHQLTLPVDSLLDERGVDFGDIYARDAITSFSSANRLQCMPYGIEPDVVFYNADLVDFTAMADRGIDVPIDHRRWSWDQFSAAAAFAARPAQGIKGIGVEPTLRGLAPFVYAGGGNLFDDDTSPTSTAFSGDGTSGAMSTLLPLLRNPKVQLTQAELGERSPLQWFEQGKLGMVVGTRALVPELRKVAGLQFDVMPIPSIENTSTVGEITGLCISRTAESPATAADFLVYASGSDAVTEVTRAGFLQPANQQVAFSDAFLQPGREPLSASVFNDAVARLRIPPLLDTWDQLEAAVAPFIEELLFSYGPAFDPASVLAAIDAASQPILSPPTPTPTPTPSGPPTGSSSP